MMRLEPKNNNQGENRGSVVSGSIDNYILTTVASFIDDRWYSMRLSRPGDFAPKSRLLGVASLIFSFMVHV